MQIQTFVRERRTHLETELAKKNIRTMNQEIRWHVEGLIHAFDEVEEFIREKEG